MKKQKLELTWIGKMERPRLEPRILLEDKARSYHAANPKPADEIAGRRLGNRETRERREKRKGK